jgi:PPOX class probable F420-dependent enzyme
MTISDKAKALFATKALGMLGVVSEDGTAQVTPMWITLDGDTPLFNTVTGRPKERHMRRDPRVTLTIVDPEDAYSYVELRGRVEFEEGKIAFDTIDALAKKYIGQDRYPWNQPGDVRVNCRMIVERELGMA